MENVSSPISGKWRRPLPLTSQNTGLNLIMALSYSARWEIVNAARKIALDVKNGALDPVAVTPEVWEKYLCTAGLPDPELMIRTSGECRISNFLLYQLAYAELYFTDTRWPDFRNEHLYQNHLKLPNQRNGALAKQANKFSRMKKLFPKGLLAIALCCSAGIRVSAQQKDTVPPTQPPANPPAVSPINTGIPQQYEIADITVAGTQYLDKSLLLSLSGLTVGDKVTYPGGDQFTKAIQSLWSQRLFCRRNHLCNQDRRQ